LKLSNEITIDDIRKDLLEIRERYNEIGLIYPFKSEWYSNALEVAQGLKALYGDVRCRIFENEAVMPNMIATQPDISKEKYDLYLDVLEKTDWDVLPVLSIFVPEYKNVLQDGHTRSRLFVDGGKRYIRSYIIEAPDAIDSVTMTVLKNGIFGRPRRVSQLPIREWGIYTNK